jgi:GrpB-like predicted nucleotidyltransferase (UPF0157 family)
LSRDDEILAAVVGEMPPFDGTIVLEDYNPAWPAHFDEEAAAVRRALGDRVLALEHVGSTSVPGLAAKPIIDIILVVADSADEAAYVPALEAAGYVLRIREPNWHQHRLFKGPNRNVNLHVFSTGCGEIARTLALRDRLRLSDSDRAAYEMLKRDLTKRHWKYVQHYADAKGEFINALLKRSEAAPEAPAEEQLRCFRCGSTNVEYRLCKVWCSNCGGLIENCSRD